MAGQGAGRTRVEHDSMGEVRVPSGALWRAQTQRAVENFPIGGGPVPLPVVHALARIKGAAARVNARLKVIDADAAAAIAAAAAEVVAGRYDEHFPIDVFQTGSGTSTNMNVNEVLAELAARAGAEVHPNDTVNAGQSSNDAFPSAIHLAALVQCRDVLIPGLEALRDALSRKAIEFADLVKSGRTHLMDATPVTLGQEFGGYAAAVGLGIERVESAYGRVGALPLGGTAVGTGINAPAGFAAAVIADLAHETGLPLTEASNHFEAQGGRDALVELSGQLRVVAVSLTKICTDLRWLGSGPSAGLGEIALPDLQPGSSIMPGKVNPVLPEATLMVCAQVIGNDAAIAWAGAAGNFELNVMMPVIARNLIDSIRLLGNASRVLAGRCVDGITPHPDRMRAYAASSPAIVTPLAPLIGYEAAARVAKDALAHGRTIRDSVVALGYLERGELTEADLDAALDIAAMTRGAD